MTLVITGLGFSLSAMAETKGKFDFAIDRGGTFTDVFARLPDGRERVLKLLSRDPQNYKDAPTEGIRRVLEEVVYTIVVYSFYEQKNRMQQKYCLIYKYAPAKSYFQAIDVVLNYFLSFGKFLPFERRKKTYKVWTNLPRAKQGTY